MVFGRKVVVTVFVFSIIATDLEPRIVTHHISFDLVVAAVDEVAVVDVAVVADVASKACWPRQKSLP